MCFTLPPCPTSRGCLFATFRLRGGEASFCPTAYLLAKRTMARSSTDLRLRLRLDHRHGGIAHPRLRGSNVRCLCELAGGVNMTCQCQSSTKRFSNRQGQNITFLLGIKSQYLGSFLALIKPGTGAVKRRACATPATKTVHITGRKQVL